MDIIIACVSLIVGFCLALFSKPLGMLKKNDLKLWKSKIFFFPMSKKAIENTEYTKSYVIVGLVMVIFSAMYLIMKILK